MSRLKIDKSVRRVCREKFYVDLFTYVEPTLTSHDPSVYRRTEDACERSGVSYPSNDGAEAFADPLLHHRCRYYLSHLSLYLAGGFFAIVAALGDSVEFFGPLCGGFVH